MALSPANNLSSSSFASPTQSSTIRNYLFRKNKKKIYPAKNKRKDSYNFATSTYTLHDSIVCDHPKEQQHRLKQENNWTNLINCNHNTNMNMGHQLSHHPQKNNPRNVLYHSDYPKNVMESILAMEPLQLLIIIGYGYSTVDAPNHHPEHPTNILIAQDIFIFLSRELYKYYPCLNVQFMRHNIDKVHWRTHQCILNYSTTFDIQIALRGNNNQYDVEFLFFGSKYELSKSFLSDQLRVFFKTTTLQTHFLHSSLACRQHPTIQYNDDIIDFPILHHITLEQDIRRHFNENNDLCSDKFNVFDGRAHASHGILHNGQMVRVWHVVNQWGREESYSVLGYIRGCFTSEITNESVLYIQWKYDEQVKHMIQSIPEHCMIVDENEPCACPDVEIRADDSTSLPSALKMLFSIARDMHSSTNNHDLDEYNMRGSQSCSKLGSHHCHLEVVLPDVSSSCHLQQAGCEDNSGFTINDKDEANAHCDGHSFQLLNGHQTQLEMRSSLFNQLHEMAWRCIAFFPHASLVLQQTYSEEILNWVMAWGFEEVMAELSALRPSSKHMTTLLA